MVLSAGSRASVDHTGPLPTIAVLTDEHFNCPPGFGRILDITYPQHMTLLSTYHITGVDDQYDFDRKQFVCPEGSQELAHMAEFDHRVKGGNLFYQAWYNQGLRAIDISNPFGRARWAITSRPTLASTCRARRVVTRVNPIQTGTRI